MSDVSREGFRREFNLENKRPAVPEKLELLLEGGSRESWRGVEIHDWQTKLDVRRDLRKEAPQMPGAGKVQAD